jgi:hypothetical protein
MYSQNIVLGIGENPPETAKRRVCIGALETGRRFLRPRKKRTSTGRFLVPPPGCHHYEGVTVKNLGPPPKPTTQQRRTARLTGGEPRSSYIIHHPRTRLCLHDLDKMVDPQ